MSIMSGGYAAGGHIGPRGVTVDSKFIEGVIAALQDDALVEKLLGEYVLAEFRKSLEAPKVITRSASDWQPGMAG